MANRRPLDGIVVLDFTQALSGSMILHHRCKIRPFFGSGDQEFGSIKWL